MLDAVAGRLLAVEDQRIVSYPGGWADYVRAQEAEPAAPPVAARPEPKPKREKPKRPAKPKPTALQLVEAEVARAEARVAELEVKLADDWADMALSRRTAQAREDLEALLEALGEPLRGSQTRKRQGVCCSFESQTPPLAPGAGGSPGGRPDAGTSAEEDGR